MEQSDEATLAGEINKKCSEQRIKVKLKWDIRNAVSVSRELLWIIHTRTEMVNTTVLFVDHVASPPGDCALYGA